MSVDINLLKRVTETEGDPATADGEAVQNVLRVLHDAESGGVNPVDDEWFYDIYKAVRDAFYTPADWSTEED